MSADGLVHALVRSAARRWPPALREEQCREWTAELAALRDQPRSGRRRFAFALSLAVSPAPDDGSGLRGWRELLPGLGGRLRPAAAFAVLSLLVLHVWPVRFNPGGYRSEAVRELSNQVFDSNGFPNLPLGTLLALSAVPLCYLLGRRSTAPLSNPVAVAGVAAVGAALGYVAYRTVPLLAFPEPHPPHGYVAAALVFVALAVPLAATTMSYARRHRLDVALPLAGVGATLAAVVSWRAGMVASPGADYDGMLFDPFASMLGSRFDRGPLGVGEINAEESFVGALFVLGAMLCAYGFGLAARAHAPATAGAAPREWSPSRTAAAAGWLALLVGLAAWSWPGAADDELRWGAVILAVLGLRVAAARRRGATLAALLLGGWLVAADPLLALPSLVDGGPPATALRAAATVAGAGLALCLAGPRARLTGADAAAGRRALAVVAVVAAACGPLLVARGMTAASASVTAVPAAFAALAVCAAASARQRPLRAGLVAALALVPVSVAAVAGTATAAWGADLTLPAAAGAGLFAVGAAALALAGQAREARRAWAAAAVLVPLVLAPVTLYVAILPGMLLRAIGGADPYSPVASFQPGVLVVVLPAAALLARWLIADRPTPTA